MLRPPLSGLRRRGRAGPLVERVAGWSAAHRKTAVLGWLLLVIAAVAVGQLLGSKNVQSYDPGQAGTAERVLNRPDVRTPPSENVLIQAPAAAPAYPRDARMRGAVRDVVASLRALPGDARRVESPLGPGGAGRISADGRSALVSFDIARPDSPQQLAALQRAVARVQARFAGLRVAEAGDASIGAAANSSVSRDFHRAEITSVPITLALLLVVFGALIAAGIPLLLAGTAVIAARSRCWPFPAGGCRSALPRLRWCCWSAWRSASTTRCSTFAASVRSGPPGGRSDEALRIAGGDLGPRDRRLRADRDDLPGRAVSVRHQRVHRPGHRHDHRGRHGGARVA